MSSTSVLRSRRTRLPFVPQRAAAPTRLYRRPCAPAVQKAAPACCSARLARDTGPVCSQRGFRSRLRSIPQCSLGGSSRGRIRSAATRPDCTAETGSFSFMCHSRHAGAPAPSRCYDAHVGEPTRATPADARLIERILAALQHENVAVMVAPDTEVVADERDIEMSRGVENFCKQIALVTQNGFQRLWLK